MLVKALADEEGSWKMTSQKYKQENKADIPTYNLWSESSKTRQILGISNAWLPTYIFLTAYWLCHLRSCEQCLKVLPRQATYMHSLQVSLFWKCQLHFQLLPEQGHRKWHTDFRIIITNVRAKMGDRNMMGTPIHISWWQNSISILYVKKAPKYRLP